MRGTHKRPKRGVPNVMNTQASQERAPCATYGFLELIQVPYGVRRGLIGQVSTPVSLRTRLKVKNTGGIFK
eukprot:7094098-Pyramimonas_sp.AAC.1